MKILFVNPPILLEKSRREIAAVIENLFYNSPPLGLAYLAAVLERQGHQVAVLDAAVEKLSLDQAVERVASFGPDAVGLTSTTNLFDCAVALGKRLKERFKDVPLILGGPHASANPEHALSFECFDVAVCGEGEQTIVELVRALSEGRAFAGVNGLAWRRNGARQGRPGALVVTPRREPIRDLDELPFPARHLLPMHLYRPQPNDQYVLPKASMIASRGCPYGCIFCDKSVFDGPYRSFGPGRIVSEMEHLIKEYGARDIAFLDSIFTTSVERVEGIIAEMKRRGVRVSWTCTARANVVTEELLREMKEAGCWRIRLGVESGSDAVLKFIRKGITTQQVRDAARWADRLGIQTKGFFMIGHLTDTRETIEETIRFARSLPFKDITVQINTPMYKTPQWEICRDYGRLLSNAYRDFSYWEPVFVPTGLTKEYLLEAYGRFYRSFYLRPVTLWRHLRHMRHVYNLLKYPRAASLLRHLFFRRQTPGRQTSGRRISRRQAPSRQNPAARKGTVIRAMTEADLGRAAQLYVEHMPDSFFVTLGRGFIEFLLRGLMRSRYGHCYVYEADSGVAGFIAATSDKKRLFREMMLRHGPALCGFALRGVLKSPATAWRLLETVGYGLATQGPSPVPAQMLFVSIDPAHRRGGACTALIGAVFEGFRREGIRQVQVSVLENNEAVNSLLKGLGFSPRHRFRVYGKDMLLYESYACGKIGGRENNGGRADSDARKTFP